MNKIFLKCMGLLKKNTVICFITDIDGLKSGSKELLQREQRELSDFHYYILHNNSMRQWLKSFAVDARTVQIEFFDFLAVPFKGERSKSCEIAFAGNLSKSLFLEKLDNFMATNENVVLNVYGEGLTTKMQRQKKIRYKGIVEPYLLPAAIEGSFGLVWDGDGSFNEHDSLAHYMQFISHHKLSLYILAGLPIIVYANAGSAELVRQYGIGITINSLEEINDKLNIVSEESYQQMRRNLQPFAKKIMSGACLSEAISTILKKIA